ncbi:MAG: right-handed parallel beta-helix repeat-containing protein, partial [Thermoplasmata archaeon]|nr:right-handed parallel beta-helix repeat-containing protein [Thermoplasmata archaeon]
MKHVIRSGLVAAVILVMIASTFAISPMNVSASSTTYIMPDGSVEPASAPIIRHGNKYKLADNVYGPIYIQKSGVTLNGDGYTVQGTPTEYGVYLNSVSHVTLKNLIVRGFYQNIKLWEADHNTILKCKVTEAAYEGIVLTASSNNVVKENEAYANGDDGISLFTTGGVGSADNVITRNKLYENRWNGMVVYGSEHRR